MAEDEKKVEVAPALKKHWYQAKKTGKVNPFIRWCFGIAKEFRRVQWMKGHDMIEAILVVLVVILIFVGVFEAVDAIFLNGNILIG